MPLDVMWELSQGWYHDRLDPAYVPPPATHYRTLLRRVGLVGAFWELA